MPHQDARHAGRALAIRGIRCRRIGIEPDAALSDAVTVRLSYDGVDEFEALRIAAGRKVEVTARPPVTAPRRRSFFGWGRSHPGDLVGGVSEAAGKPPTLELDFRVPPGFDISIDVGGATRIDIGAVEGPLELDLSGSVRAEATGGAPLALDLSGDCRAEVGTVRLSAEVNLSGSSEAVLREVAVERLSLECAGGVTARVGGGSARTLDIEAAGACDLVVGASVSGDAGISASGAGRIMVAAVSGKVEHDVSGSAKVVVGGTHYGRPSRR